MAPAPPSSVPPENFRIGAVNPRHPAGGCCRKPLSCTMSHPGCLHLRDPIKRATLFHDRTVPCPKTALRGADLVRCVLLNEHEGPCELEVVTPSWIATATRPPTPISEEG